MASIAEQIYDALSRSAAVENSDAYPRQCYCEQIARDCIANKADLIAVLSKHPNWDPENCRVHFNKDFVRQSDAKSARTHLARAMCIIYDAIDSEYRFSDSVIENNDRLNTLVHLWHVCHYIESYSYDFAVDSISDAVANDLRARTERASFADKTVKFTFEDAHIHAGTKGTKQVMKLMRQYGFDLLDNDTQHKFLQEYSQFADCMNPITITRHTVLSVNPVDFLYMSVGNSWTSCHNILQGGCYCGGCESYAYDHVSMIFYTVDSTTPDDRITSAPKINRQMNFFNGDALLSVRVYPQSCDGDSAMYNECKGAVQQILADCLGRPNLWKETEWTQETHGYQYPDYTHFGPYKAYRLSDVTLSERRSWIQLIPRTDCLTGEIVDYKSRFVIGSYDAICACCGEPLDSNDYPICSECADDEYNTCDSCGRRMDPDYSFWIDDTCLCENCFDNQCFCCDFCGHDYFNDEGTWVESEERMVCNDCLEDRFETCAECGEYYRRDDMTELPNGDWICPDCRYAHYEQCDDCGEWERKDDMTYVQDFGYVCEDCIENGDYNQCIECGRWFKYEEGENLGDYVKGGAWACRECLDKYYEYTRKENM